MKRILSGVGILILLAGAGAAGCGTPIPYDQIRDTTSDVIPIFRSNRVRSMHVTYYLASLEQESGDVTVDFDLTNGFGHHLGAVTAWVTLHGENGEIVAHPQPVGPMAPHATHRIIFELEEVEFHVADVEVGGQISP